jgi:uncharacterized protein (UPF0332 family)
LSLSRDLLATAEKLAKASKGKPKRADLRRAVSSAYYALFHAIAEDAANLLVGVRVNALDKAWAQAYRALEHGAAKNACKEVRNLGFPTELAVVAELFISLQEKRHSADYDPMLTLSRADAMEWISLATTAIEALSKADRGHRKAFAVHVLMKRR